jgi:hypothetical protein
MTAIGHERLARESRLGWRPLVIRPIRDVDYGTGMVRSGLIYDSVERNGTVYAMVGQKAVEIEPDEFCVLAWGLSEDCLKRMGVR